MACCTNRSLHTSLLSFASSISARLAKGDVILRLRQHIPLESFLLRMMFVFSVFFTLFYSFNTTLSSTTSSKSVVAQFSSSLVVVLICPYSASSTLTSSSFNDSPNSGSEWAPLTSKPGSTISHESLDRYVSLWPLWMSTTTRSQGIWIFPL